MAKWIVNFTIVAAYVQAKVIINKTWWIYDLRVKYSKRCMPDYVMESVKIYLLKRRRMNRLCFSLSYHIRLEFKLYSVSAR